MHFEADRKWCSVCAKVKMFLLKGKLDAVAVSKRYSQSYIWAFEIFPWATVIWGKKTRKDYKIINVNISNNMFFIFVLTYDILNNKSYIFTSFCFLPIFPVNIYVYTFPANIYIYIYTYYWEMKMREPETPKFVGCQISSHLLTRYCHVWAFDVLLRILD